MPIKTDKESALKYGRALYDIQDAISGKEWSTDTLDRLAEIMGNAGFHIYDSDDCDGDGVRWFTTSSGRIELQMSLQEAESGGHQGQCDEGVEALSKEPHIAAQLAEIDSDLLRAELKEYGAWEDPELEDHETNLQRLLWLACGDIRDNETDRENERSNDS